MTALRELLASFKVEVDPEGNLARGNRAVDALKGKLQSLDAATKRIAPVAVPAMAPGRASLPSGTGALAGAAPGGGFGALRSGALAAGNAARGAFSTFASGLSSLVGPAALATLGIGALTRQTLQLVDSIGGIGEAAAKLGVTNAEFQRLDVLARQNATSVESLGTAFRTLATNAVDPSKEAAAAFRQLGVDTRNADGSFKERNELFFETAGALADIQDSTQRAALAQKIYGRGALELSALLASGRAGLEAQRAELEKLPVLSDEVIAKADAFGDSWIYAKAQLAALAGPVLNDLVIPGLQWMVDLIKGNSGALQIFARHALTVFKTILLPIRVVWDALKSVGGAFSALFKTVTGGSFKFSEFADILGRVGVALTSLATFPVLLAQDFQTYLAGGDSAIGRAIEGLGALFSKAADIARDAFSNFFAWVGEQLRQIPGAVAKALTPSPEFAMNLQPTAGPGGLLGISPPVLPPAQPERQGTTVIDNSTKTVQVNMPQGSSPMQTADAVSKRLESDRAGIAARVP